jgi:mutator protein MutT
MQLRKVSLLIPYNENEEILFQDRRKLNKKLSKDFGFFGGGFEHGEDKKDALKREVMEELSINVDSLEDLRFFKRYYYEKPELDIARELFVFLCKMPDINKLTIKEGQGIVIKISDAIKLNISDMDKQILKEVLDEINVF